MDYNAGTYETYRKCQTGKTTEMSGSPDQKMSPLLPICMVKTLRNILSVLGPGIFAIGYTIGTGFVTSMAKAGADYGLGLLWVLALSCLFSGVLMTAYGRFAAVTDGVAAGGPILPR